MWKYSMWAGRPASAFRHKKNWGGTTWTGDFKWREVKTRFYRNRLMQTDSSGTLIGWKSCQTPSVPLWDRMEGAWLWTLYEGEKRNTLYIYTQLAVWDITMQVHTASIYRNVGLLLNLLYDTDCTQRPCIFSWPMVISNSVNEFFVAV